MFTKVSGGSEIKETTPKMYKIENRNWSDHEAREIYQKYGFDVQKLEPYYGKLLTGICYTEETKQCFKNNFNADIKETRTVINWVDFPNTDLESHNVPEFLLTKHNANSCVKGNTYTITNDIEEHNYVTICLDLFNDDMIKQITDGFIESWSGLTNTFTFDNDKLNIIKEMANTVFTGIRYTERVMGNGNEFRRSWIVSDNISFPVPDVLTRIV